MSTSSNFTTFMEFVKNNFRVVKMFLFATVLAFAFSVSGHAKEVDAQAFAEATTQNSEETTQNPEQTTTEQKIVPIVKNGLVQENGKYYFYKNGKMQKNFWKTVEGKKYYFKANGQAATGSCKIKKKYYIFNEEGVFKKYKSEQPLTVGNNVYFVSKKGLAAPGWHVYKGKLYYTWKSGLCVKSQKVDGITFTEDSYAKNNENARLKIKARKIVARITNSKMSKAQKRRACWNYMVKRGRFHYALKYPKLSKKGWQRSTALNMLTTKRGNCYSFACGFAALTKEIGDKPVVICGRVSGRRDHARDGMTRHSWVQIGGKNYDPEGQFAGWAKGIYGSSRYRVRHSIQKKVVF